MIVDVKPEIGDSVDRILRRIDLDVFFCSVQDVSHPDRFQVIYILDRFAVRKTDAAANLINKIKKIVLY
jgi:hypothetical protein